MTSFLATGKRGWSTIFIQFIFQKIVKIKLMMNAGLSRAAEEEEVREEDRRVAFCSIF